MNIKYNNRVAKFYTISYYDTQYLRGGNTQTVEKKYNLFNLIDSGETMKLLPTSPFVMRYRGLKEYINKNQTINIKTVLDIKYSGSPTVEQEEILNNIKTRISKYKYYGGLIVMKTGRGKSHTIAQVLGEYKCRTVISVHNIKTLQEMKLKLKEFLKGKFTIGTFYGSKKEMGDIIITTHTSLSKYKGIIEIDGEKFKPELLLYDEADRNLSDKMIKSFCNIGVKAMYGLTGTPNSKNLLEKDINKIFGKTIKSDLGGYNLIPVIKYIRYKPTEIEYKYKTYSELRDCLLEDDERFEKQIKYIRHVMKYRKFGLLLSDRVTDVENYYKELKDDGYNIILIHGNTKVDDDSEKIESAINNNKKTLIIGTSGKMSRGVDIPQIDTIFLFYPNKFESATIQAVGRGLRKYEGKQNTLLVDWCDTKYLSNQMYSRRKTYKSEYNVAIGKEDEAREP